MVSFISNIKLLKALFLYNIELSRLVKNLERDEDLEQVQDINNYNLILLNNYQQNKFQSRKYKFDVNCFNENPLKKYLM